MTKEVLEINVIIDDYCKRIKEATDRYGAGDLKHEAWSFLHQKMKQLYNLNKVSKTIYLCDFWERKIEHAMVEGYWYTSKEAWVFGRKESKRYDGHRYDKYFFSCHCAELDFDEF